MLVLASSVGVGVAQCVYERAGSALGIGAGEIEGVLASDPGAAGRSDPGNAD